MKISETIQDDVRAYYADKARTIREGADCCPPSACDCASSYPAETLVDIPAEISGASFGCGNPIGPALLKSGERVVDLGSGGGLDCFLAGRLVGLSGRVIGVDMTDAMLELAQGNARRLNIDNVSFRKGTIEDLPLEDQSVDVVLSNCVINLSPDKPAVFAEMYRVLAPGGRVSLADVVRKGDLSSDFLALEDGWESCITGALTVDDYAQGLRQAGFERVEIVPADGRALATIPEGHPVSASITASRPT